MENCILRNTFSDYEEHHIIPRSLFKKAGYEYSLIDDASNIAFLTEKANRRISNKSPETYLSEIDLEKLKKQFIPLDKNLYKIENYELFLQQRCKQRNTYEKK